MIIKFKKNYQCVRGNKLPSHPGGQILIFVLTIISVSIEGVEPTEWGLVMNNINQSLKDVPVKDGGLNWVGLTNSIKRYPSTI